MVSQVLIWEWQQQIRNDPGSRHDHGKLRADQYYEIVKGRPVEQAYHWILKQIAQHRKTLSFADTSESDAPNYHLRYHPDTKTYSVTLTDTNNLNLNLDLKPIAGGKEITLTRSGNQYTFTSSKKLTHPVTIQYQKQLQIYFHSLSGLIQKLRQKEASGSTKQDNTSSVSQNRMAFISRYMNQRGRCRV